MIYRARVATLNNQRNELCVGQIEGVGLTVYSCIFGALLRINKLARQLAQRGDEIQEVNIDKRVGNEWKPIS
jgi:hypothetical protein